MWLLKEPDKEVYRTPVARLYQQCLSDERGEQNQDSKLPEPSPTKICHARSRSTSYESVLQE